MVAEIFLGLLDAAKMNQRLAVGRRRHSQPAIFVDCQLQVLGDFRVVIPVDASVAENREEALQPLAEAVDHGSCSPSGIASMRCITAESRCQYAASLRPRRVMETPHSEQIQPRCCSLTSES